VSQIVYLDSSAILKLVFEEAESPALRDFLKTWPHRTSSALARIEVTRIVARVEDPLPVRDAERMLRRVHLVRIDDKIVSAAATLEPRGLRSLDAIHLATARMLGHPLAGLVTYDRLLAAAASRLGMTVWAPT